MLSKAYSIVLAWLELDSTDAWEETPCPRAGGCAVFVDSQHSSWVLRMRVVIADPCLRTAVAALMVSRKDLWDKGMVSSGSLGPPGDPCSEGDESTALCLSGGPFCFTTRHWGGASAGGSQWVPDSSPSFLTASQCHLEPLSYLSGFSFLLRNNRVSLDSLNDLYRINKITYFNNKFWKVQNYILWKVCLLVVSHVTQFAHW